MGRVVEAATQIQRKVGCTVILLHHAGWATLHERGSNVLRGACDGVFHARRVGGRLTLINVKQKDGPHASTSVLETREIDDSLVLESTSEPAAGRTLRATTLIRDALAAEGAMAMTHGAICAKTGISKATASRHLSALVDAEEVVKDPQGRFRLVQD